MHFGFEQFVQAEEAVKWAVDVLIAHSEKPDVLRTWGYLVFQKLVRFHAPRIDLPGKE